MDNGATLKRIEDLLIIVALMLDVGLGVGVGLLISHALGGF